MTQIKIDTDAIVHFLSQLLNTPSPVGFTDAAMDFIEKPADLEALTEKIKKAQARKMILVERKAEEEVREILISKGW